MSQFLGVAFGPYVGRWTGTPPNATTPWWNSYSLQYIVRMLEVIASKFNKICTYGMGYAGYYQPSTPLKLLWLQLTHNAKSRLAKLDGPPKALVLTTQLIT